MNPMNPMMLMQMREMFARFNNAHPKVMPFFQAVSTGGINEDSVIEMKVTNPQGQTYLSSIRVTAEDMEMIRQMQELSNGMR